MSANATATPTTNFSIPKFNTASDAPNGRGINEMMDALDALFLRSTPSAGGSNGQVLSWVSGASAWKSRAIHTSTAASSTNTTSGTFFMCGLAGTITPTATGNVFFHITATVQNDLGSGVGTQSYTALYTGTGTAPANNATATGTQRTSTLTMMGNFAGEAIQGTYGMLVSGLTVGTTYWYDLGKAVQSGTVTVSIPNMAAFEV